MRFSGNFAKDVFQWVFLMSIKNSQCLSTENWMIKKIKKIKKRNILTAELKITKKGKEKSMKISISISSILNGFYDSHIKSWHKCKMSFLISFVSSWIRRGKKWGMGKNVFVYPTTRRAVFCLIRVF